ncbi:MAG: tetratricopeptide repeat protein [Desulfobacterales bacterium]
MVHELQNCIECFANKIANKGTMSLSPITADDTRSVLSQQVDQAIACHQAGRLDRADALCRSILERHPRHPDALHLLGVSAQVRGEYAEAIDLIRRALAENPTSPNYQNNLGNSLMAAGSVGDAIDAFKAALALAPRLAAIWLNLANAYLQQERLSDAAACIQTCLEISPQNAAAHLTLGKINRSKGDLAGAQQHILRSLALEPASVDALKELARLFKRDDRLAELELHIRRILESAPGSGELWCLLADVYRQLKRPDSAEKAYHYALKTNEHLIPALNGLGVLFAEQGRFDSALHWFQKGIAIDPENASLHGNLGNLYRRFGKTDKARRAFRCTLELDPDNIAAKLNLGSLEYEQGRMEFAERLIQEIIECEPRRAVAYSNLGVVLKAQGKLVEARQAFQTAIRLDSKDPDPICNLGNVYKAQGCILSAISCYRRVLELSPDHKGANSNYLYGQLYLPSIDCRELYTSSRRWGRGEESRVQPYSHNFAEFNPTKRLSIGYVSPDFRKHSVSYFFHPLLEAHDRRKFEIYCYAEVRHPDEITQRIRQSCDKWRSTVGHPDQIAAEQIHRDQIDILVDLAGHTADNRLGIFVRKPAPIQVSWLGYPGTTGLSRMDYRLTDSVADPKPEADPFYTERLHHLPKGFLCYRPPDNAPPVVAKNTDSQAPIVFGSFNNLPKINERVIALWAKILRRVPNSRLLLKSKPLADKTTRDRYRNFFRQYGIDVKRIGLKHWTASTADHLGLYSDISVALDPFPYNGTTTTCEALFMGVPVVTLSGARHSARVGASMLQRLGVTGLVAENESDYVKLAVNLARDSHRLQLLRTTLRGLLLNSSLCDGKQFASEVENFYLQIWHRWCRPLEKSLTVQVR